MGERLGKTDTAERLLGLKQELIDRLQPLLVREISTYPSEVPVCVEIRWPKLGELGGGIKLHFAKEVDRHDSSLRGFSPNMLSSSFYSLEDPFHALSAVLTMMATIDETARVLEEDLSHVVRANKNVQPYFQRFREAGLYDYCDSRGRTRRKPHVINGRILYVCRYPVEGMNSILGKFVVDEAVGEVIRLREERMNERLCS